MFNKRHSTTETGASSTHATRHGEAPKFRWALWCGLGIFVGSMVVKALLMLLTDIQLSDESDPFTMLSGVLPPALIILLIVAILPCIEEFSFRWWGRDTRVAYVVDIVLISLYVGNLSHSIWLLLIAAATLSAIVLFAKGDRRLLLMMIASSLLFASVHASNYADMDLDTLSSLLQIFGLALVLSYLSINYSLWWSIAAHAANNALTTLVLMVPASFATEHYEVTINTLWSQGEFATYEEHGTTAVFKGSILIIANSLQYKQDYQDSVDFSSRHTFYRSKFSATPTLYEMSVKGKEAGQPWYYAEVLQGLIDNHMLFADTTREPLLLLTIADDTLAHTFRQGDTTTTVGNVVRDLQICYDMPIVLGGEVDKEQPINVCTDSLKRCTYGTEQEVAAEAQQRCRYLRRTCGVTLKQSDNEQAQIVTFRQ